MRHFDYFHVSVCASRGKNDDGKQLNQKQQQQKKAQNEMAHTHIHWRTSISRLTHTHNTHTCSKCQDSNRRTFAAPEAPLVQDGNYFMLHTMSSMPHKQTAAAAADSGVVMRGLRGQWDGECINTVSLTNTYLLIFISYYKKRQIEN